VTVPLDRYIPVPDVRERHEVTIAAPAQIVFKVARGFDIQSIRIVRLIFWLRERALGAKRGARWRGAGLVADMRAIGWVPLADESDRLFIAGAVCQPWQADVMFRSVPAERFASFTEPDLVKIAWTLEAQTLAPALTRFATETRAVATDDIARAKFLRYWRTFRAGIVLIRLLLLPALRREAERRFRRQSTGV